MPSTDSEEPTRPKDLNDNDDPNEVKSNTDNELPSLHMLLKDKADATCTLPTTDNADQMFVFPNRTIPLTEMEDPRRAMLRKDREAPT